MKHFISELFLLWTEAGNKRYTKEETDRATRETLEGILKKCPDFPAQLPVTRQPVPLYRRTMFRVAAVVVPLMVIGAAICLWHFNAPQADTFKEMIAVEAVNDDKWVEMPDGSTIKLEEGARLEYLSDFTVSRKVKLSGAAFFKVAKKNGMPFEVQYNEINVRVLGTEFYVSKYAERAEVTLCTGSVEVSSANFRVLLEPRQQFATDADGKNYSVVELSEKEIARVYHGPLRFKNTPLNEALQQTGQYFGAEIDVSSVKNNAPIRMKAGMHDELEDVLYMLQLVSNKAFTYQIDGEQVMIKGN